jgi:hypothetical protein
MKKILIASTALVAAGFITAGSASASEKISLNLGGYSKWWVVGAWNKDSYQSNVTGASQDLNSVDVKGDNEVYFGGKTKLDNGMEVGIDIQLEAGGHTDTVGGDTIDESYIWLGGQFGKFIVGSKNNGTYLLHVTAPDAAGNWNEGGMLTGGFSLGRPAAVSSITPLNGAAATTAIVTDNDAEGITYVAPSFYGLTVGGSYKPNGASEDNRSATNIGTVGEVYGVGALYANTFGGVGVKLSGGWATYDVVSAGTAGKSDVNEFAFGTQLSYAGFTLGGSYRNVNGDAAVDGLDGNAFDVGLQYASGPYAVSLAYFRSSVEGDTTVAANDTQEFYQLSAKYNLGAGVDALASVGHGKYKNETAGDANSNKGWVAMTGLSLQF